MNDLAGILFFVLLALGAFFGLRALSAKKPRTEADFERGAEESASLLGAGVNALQGMLQPDKKRSEESIRELKESVHRRKSGAEENHDGDSGEVVNVKRID
ncbi:MAG: hypothetical protein DWQ47_17665 [Acidobacteria bacterium]|nr:MAG: hypothetical protein DWQ32_05065 [Acidobacteriota bacterium]REK02134.1 MAG: hypothetical protein DWQ38_07090 [Acidobacteriota bacterium]REK14064.1 MAG: hypothetical protein DWQ43_10755 [Acidobacteriota bacterium]REK42059.1 MAG: hypothetical protein DWQ47_17665 [Acidobacteriota bacterium]